MVGIPTIEGHSQPTAADLPLNHANWVADPDRAVLLVHDMQRFFLRPFPSRLRAELIGNAAMLRQRCIARGVPVAYTAQPGDMAAEQRGLLAAFWGPGMQASEADREIVEQLAPGPADWIFTKWRYSAFFGSDLLQRLRASGRDQLIICGVYAHVGVLVTAIEAFSHDLETFVVADAVADFTADHHRRALAYVAETCAVVTTADQVFA